MIHHRISRLLFLMLFLCLGHSGNRSFAQNLAFDPGFLSVATGDPTGEIQPTQIPYSGPASGFVFNNDGGIALASDSYGNIYLANFRTIWVIASGKGPIPVLPSAGSNPVAGNVYLVAGNSQAPSTSTPPCGSGTDAWGDGCPALQAYVGTETGDGTVSIQGGLAVDSHNNLYLTDASDIRVIYSGTGSIPNLPANAQAGYIYIIANTAMANSGPPGDGASALDAIFNGATGLSIDGNGNIYVADAGNNVVRVIYEGGTVPNLPAGAVPGNVYTIGGQMGNTCALNETSLGYFQSAACGDDGPATSAQLGGFNYFGAGGQFGISGVYVDSNGNVYINDTPDFRIRAIYASGNLPNVSSPVAGNIYTIAGNGTDAGYWDSNLPTSAPSGLPPGADGPALQTSFANLSGITGDAGGNIYITDADRSTNQNVTAYNAVRRIDPSGNIKTVAPYAAALCPQNKDVLGDGCPANAIQIGLPTNLAVDPSGNLFVSDLVSGLEVVHELSVSQTTLTAVSTISRPVQQIVTVTNTGSQPLQLSGIAYQGNNGDTSFSQGATGGQSDCSTSTLLSPGASCQLGIEFTPESAASVSGTMVVASNALNASQGSNLIQLSGTATQSQTTTNLSIVPEVANVGQQVTVTATIVPDFGSEKTPTGTVTFSIAGGATLGTANVTNGVATLQPSNLAPGTYSLQATYSGDTNYLGSTSYPGTLTVSSTQVPGITLTTSSSAVNAGQTVTFTASLTPYSGTVVPTGTVTFQDGIVTLGSAPLNASGTATFSTNVLEVGLNSLVAVYSGDSLYASAVSTQVSVTVTSTAQLQITPGIISDAAGVYNFNSNSTNSGGDGGPASSAQFNQPEGVATDANGNVYILDYGNDIIRAVYNGQGSLPGISNPQPGYIYLVAGTAQTACSSPTASCGDGGPAIGALLGNPSVPGTILGPTALTVDAAGNLYIGDGNNYRIRKVDAQTGVITTIAGNGTTGDTGDGGAATAAQIAAVSGIAVDNAGDVYFSDATSHVIRRIDALSAVITTIAGIAGNASYTADGNFAATSSIVAYALTLDKLGNLYYLDGSSPVGGDDTIRKIDAATGLLTTVAGSALNPAGDSGDGGPAPSAQFGNTSFGLAVDPAGNLYIADESFSVVRVVNAVTGIINTIAGTTNSTCSSAPCGDGSLATSAQLKNPQAIALDQQGNLFIADTYSAVIREVAANSTAFNFGSQNQGTSASQTITITNTGGTLLILNGLTFSDPSFSQQPSGGTDCSATTTLSAGAQCQIAVSFLPLQATSIQGTLTIGSSASNVSNGQTVIPLAGTGVSLGGGLAQTVTFPALPATIQYGATIPLQALASSGLPITYVVQGPGKLKGATLTATGLGLITVTAYQFGEDSNGNPTQYAAASATQTTTATGGVTLTVTADDQSYIQGSPVPALTYSIIGLIPGDTTTGTANLTTSATQSSPTGTYPIVITQGTLQAPAAYQMSFVPGTMNVTGSAPQTIMFNPIGNVTYGDAPITLSATASSGDPVKFFLNTTSSTSGLAPIPGPPSVLPVTAAGPVTVTAKAYGDHIYKAATPVSQTITVAQHPLTINGPDITITQGQPIALAGYSVNASQLVNGDIASAVVTGAPTLTTIATQSSPPGTYPITITQGSLTAANYVFSFVNGTLTIVQGQPQTVTFAAIPNTTYGAGPITLDAGTSAGPNYPIVFSVQRGAGANLASISGKTLTINGAGQITVVATQPGDSTYAPASTTQTLTVAPAVATITANPETRPNNSSPNLPVEGEGFSISGLVNNDTAAVISGSPALTTTAMLGSPVGTYPINIAQGTLAAANYTFNLVGGTLTITPGGPQGGFSLTATPGTLAMLSGQTRQSVILLTPINYYMGLVQFSCGKLPANVSCTFSPGTLAPDGSGNPVQTAITVNTNSNSPVVGELRPEQKQPTLLAAAFYLPGVLSAFFLTAGRKRLNKHIGAWHGVVLLLLLAGAIGLIACGGGNTSGPANNGDAAPGTSTVTVTATGADGTTTSINIPITVE